MLAVPSALRFDSEYDSPKSNPRIENPILLSLLRNLKQEKQVEMMPEAETSMQSLVSLHPNIQDLSLASGCVLESILSDPELKVLPGEIVDGIQESFCSRIRSGHLFRASLTVQTFRKYVRNPTSEDRIRSCILGWLVEMFHSCLGTEHQSLYSNTRRPTRPGKFDAVIQAACLKSLSVFFRRSVCYPHLMTLFHDCQWRLAISEKVDAYVVHCGNLEEHTNDIHSNTVADVNNVQMFYMPVAAGMILAGVGSEATLQTVVTMATELGRLYTASEEYLDVFDLSDPFRLGSNIDEAKCTWLTVEAMRRGNKEQKRMLKDHFAKPDKASALMVKNCFIDIGLPSTFAEFYRDSLSRISQAMDAMPCATLKAVYTDVLTMLNFQISYQDERT